MTVFLTHDPMITFLRRALQKAHFFCRTCKNWHQKKLQRLTWDGPGRTARKNPNAVPYGTALILAISPDGVEVFFWVPELRDFLDSGAGAGATGAGFAEVSKGPGSSPLGLVDQYALRNGLQSFLAGGPWLKSAGMRTGSGLYFVFCILCFGSYAVGGRSSRRPLYYSLQNL